MSKLIVIPSSKKMIYEISNQADGFMIGIDNLSVNLPCTFSYDEVVEIIKYLHKEKKDLFIALNKNMHTKDLLLLEDILVKLDSYNVTGILYYDISLVELKNKLQLKTPLVWSEEHLTTNYATMNYWKNEGVGYAYVSAEITLDEILTISKNTDMKLMVPIFGYLPMFVSKRNLISNYKEYFHLEDSSHTYTIFKEGKYYPIDNHSMGTVVYSASVLNGLKELKILEENNISYVTLNSYRIADEIFMKVLTLYKNRMYDSEDQIQEWISNIDKGFLYKETVYRVKKNEKE